MTTISFQIISSLLLVEELVQTNKKNQPSTVQALCEGNPRLDSLHKRSVMWKACSCLNVLHIPVKPHTRSKLIFRTISGAMLWLVYIYYTLQVYYWYLEHNVIGWGSNILETAFSAIIAAGLYDIIHFMFDYLVQWLNAIECNIAVCVSFNSFSMHVEAERAIYWKPFSLS